MGGSFSVGGWVRGGRTMRRFRRGTRRSVLFWVLILTIIQGPDKGKTFELPDTEPQLLGRSSEALPITDSTVSRRHAELTPDDGRWWLRDLGSQNGTYLNGVRI